MIEDGMGWIIVDALDTAMIMNLSTPVQHARNWIRSSLSYDRDHDVSTFETTIRMLGGLLSAHYLSTTHPDLAPLAEDDPGSAGEDLYLEKAADLADRLRGAFESGSGVPYASVNLRTSKGIPSHDDAGASSTAEAASLQLEFKYLAKLTGETAYWQLVEKVMQVLEGNGAAAGLVPIFVQADSGKFHRNIIRLGSRGDSYYEYLIKQFLQTNKEEPVYLDMWDEALAGIRKHLVTYTKHASLTVIGERPGGLEGELSPKMDHLVCFLPGTIALAATGGRPVSQARQLPDWSSKQEEELLLARELMKTCWATYLATKTGLAGEITYFEIDDPPRMEADVLPAHLQQHPITNTVPPQSRSRSSSSSAAASSRHGLPYISRPLSDPAWRSDLFVKPMDRHNLQRPETVESLFY
ncbi:mannosyl-oligosaccharide alpha-1,2-mannosidase, partial [Ascosphaera acerosa]